MKTTRKPSDVREKELQLAVYRIKHGRAHTGEKLLTIAAVAREAGVSSALIHNHYPQIANDIRIIQERSSRNLLEKKRNDLKVEQEKNRELRQQIEVLLVKIANLASLNEVLINENQVIKAKSFGDGVSDLRKVHWLRPPLRTL